MFASLSRNSQEKEKMKKTRMAITKLLVLHANTIIMAITQWYINTGLASSGEKSGLKGRWSSSVLADNLLKDGVLIKTLVVVPLHHH